MGYFAARSAPLGQVPTEVVTAMFYNFSPARVAKALPAAWDIAAPSAVLAARLTAAAAALRRYGLPEAGDVATAADSAGQSGAPRAGERATAVRG